MTFHIMTLFPEMIAQGLRTSVIGRAIENGIVGLRTYQIRDFSADEKHRKVDDYTYGGGAGMLMQAQPVYDCYLHVLSQISQNQTYNNEISNTEKESDSIEITCTEKGTYNSEISCTKKQTDSSEITCTKKQTDISEITSAENRIYIDDISGFATRPETTSTRRPRMIYVTPQGKPFTQEMARAYAKSDDLIILCGHYEGIDERVLEETGAERVSIGDYVLTGGELPAMVIADAVARLVPGVLSNEESAQTESFDDGLLEYPQYTRPEVWRERRVPEILLSGDHAKVDAWRLEQSIARTKKVRPDLYEAYRIRRETNC